MKKICVIDDNNYKLAVELKKKAIELKEEYDFVIYKTNEIKEIEKINPALIIMNEEKIEKEAIKVLEEIKEVESLSSIPIFMISDSSTKKHKENMMKQGILYYERNPYSIDTIYSQMENILKILNITKKISPLTGLPRKYSNPRRNWKKNKKRRGICYTILRFR